MGGKHVTFIDGKCQSLHNQGKKAAKIVWTRTWRITNKKIKVVRDAKKIKKRAKKVQRAIQGLEKDDITARKSEQHKQRIRMERQKRLQQQKQKKNKAAAKKAPKRRRKK